MKKSTRTYILLPLVLIGIGVGVYFYFFAPGKPLDSKDPAVGITYYQKDLDDALKTGDTARALADIPLLQKFTRELYIDQQNQF